MTTIESIEKSDFLIYTSKDGETKIDVKFENESVWLSQSQMGILFGKGKTTISEHINNIYKEGELVKELTLKKSGISGFQQKPINFYNLDMIISIGYRVRSLQGTQFRKWATEKLKEYIIKGFVIDDERLKEGGGKARYLDELLQKIRDIRSSERNFYQKITDIYTTSIDYKKDEILTKQFFATVQNKMHFAVHGRTAAELVKERVDFNKNNLGLTNFKGDYITQKDVGIAKNYLLEEELNQLNLIVSMYLDFAELQATNGRLMKMKDWIDKLDFFLMGTEKKILKNHGDVSHKEAIEKAKNEYEKYRIEQDKKYISDFDLEIKKIKQIKKG